MKNTFSFSRRHFLKRTAAGLTVLPYMHCSTESKTKTLPTRILGKTGLEISTLSFGGGSQFLKNKDGDWETMLEDAVNSGITLYDTASSYKWRSNMSSEERFGEILPKYRNDILISTKFDSRYPDQALREIETSLKKMKTDYLDFLLIHSIEESEDIEKIEQGVYQEMLKLKEQKVARFIGFSSMNSAEKSKELMEKLDVDVAILAMNPTKYGDFAKVALPVARANNVGVIAMKVMRNIVDKQATATELLSYALNQPGTTSAVVGHYGQDVMNENMEIVRNIAANNTAIHSSTLEKRLAHLAGPHALCWAHPDYRDGYWV